MRNWMILMAGAVALAGCSKQAAPHDPARYGAGQCGGLAPGWFRPDQREFEESEAAQLVEVGPGGVLSWNLDRVDEKGLAQHLDEAQTRPHTRFNELTIDDSVGCDVVRRIRQLFADHALCGHGQICYEYTSEQSRKAHRSWYPEELPASSADSR